MRPRRHGFALRLRFGIKLFLVWSEFSLAVSAGPGEGRAWGRFGDVGFMVRAGLMGSIILEVLTKFFHQTIQVCKFFLQSGNDTRLERSVRFHEFHR